MFLSGMWEGSATLPLPHCTQLLQRGLQPVRECPNNSCGGALVGFPWGLTQSLGICLSQKFVFCSEEAKHRLAVDTVLPSLSLVYSAQIQTWAGAKAPSVLPQHCASQRLQTARGVGVNLNLLPRKHRFCLSKYQLCWFLHPTDEYRNEETLWNSW